MFFFLPFAEEPLTRPRAQIMLQRTALPQLPAPHSARAEQKTAANSGFADAISQAGYTALDLFKRALSSMASSMTALGSRASLLFGQVAATLAYQRMARETAAFFGMFWPGFAGAAPRNGFAGRWLAPTPEPQLFACFGLPGDANPWPVDPFAGFAQALGIWAGFFGAGAPAARNQPAPVAATLAFPGFWWTFRLA
jgi:hypothetical protein